MPVTAEPPLPVLIVEDDEPTQKLLQAVLRRAGFPTQFASNGAEAIELLRRDAYAAVILDLMMPHVGGEAVIEHLARAVRAVPVIVCTAAGTAVLSTLDRSIVRVVIRKPFDVFELIEAVTSVALTASRRLRALIVDDDARARYTLRTLLEPADVVEAETGHAAFRIAPEFFPDVILLDLILPGAPGEEILRELRAREETRSIPVVVVTSRMLSLEQRAKLLQDAVAVVYKGDLSRETMREALAAARSPRR